MMNEHLAGTKRYGDTITHVVSISKIMMFTANWSEEEHVYVRRTRMVAASRGPRYSHDSKWILALHDEEAAAHDSIGEVSMFAAST